MFTTTDLDNERAYHNVTMRHIVVFALVMKEYFTVLLKKMPIVPAITVLSIINVSRFY